MLSKLPIISLSVELATKDISAVLVVVEMKSGRAFSTLVVDLASNPSQSRSALAQELVAHLQRPGAQGVDMIVGDFNMTPGSRALELVQGERQNAFEVAGTGWGGTWPGARPVLRLDHALVSPRLTVRDARTFSIGGAHRGLLLNLAFAASKAEPSAEEKTAS